MTLRRHRLYLALALFLGLSVTGAHGQVYKCTDAAGKTTYADTPCNNRSKPLKLPDDGRGTPTDPRMCEQLQDELSRLAAERERNAQRGRAESAGGVKRQASLTRQYEARCVGISRAAPASH